MSSADEETSGGSSGSLPISDSEIVSTFPQTKDSSSTTADDDVSSDETGVQTESMPDLKTQKEEIEKLLLKSLRKDEVVYFPKELQTYIGEEALESLTHFLEGIRAVVIVSQNLNPLLGSDIAVPRTWLYDICIFSPDHPMIILSIVKTKSQKETDLLYNAGLSRALTAIVRRNTLLKFSVVNGVVEQSMCKSPETFSKEIEKFLLYASNVSVPTSLQMEETKYLAVLKTFLALVKTPISTVSIVAENVPDCNHIEVTGGTSSTEYERSMSHIQDKENDDAHEKCVDKGAHEKLAAELDETRKELKACKKMWMRSKSSTSTEEDATAYTYENEEDDILADTDAFIHSAKLFDGILQRTNEDISTWTHGIVKLSVVDTAVEKIQDGQKWILITGQAGEGKTSLGYMVLNEFKERGYDVLSVSSPQEYQTVSEKMFERHVVMVDDIFGRWDLDPQSLTEWTDKLRKVTMDRNRKSASCQMIFIIQSCILKKARSFLPDSDNNVIDLTDSITNEERLNLLNHYLQSEDVSVTEEEKSQVVSVTSHYGFAHSCRLYFCIRNILKGLRMSMFFIDPIRYLEEAILESVRISGIVQLFKSMLKSDGELALLNVTDENLKKTINVILEDPASKWLFSISEVIKFIHPTIYKCVAFVLGKKNPVFVIKDLPLSFVMQNVSLVGTHGEILTSNFTKNDVTKHLLRKLSSALKMNNYSIFTHSFCHSESFVKNLLKSAFTKTCNSPGTHQTQLKGTMRQKSTSDEEVQTLLNATDKFGQTMLMVTANDGNANAVRVLLNLGADINMYSSDVQNGEQKTVLHHLIKHHTYMSIIELMLRNKADVNLPDITGVTPLHTACKNETSDHLGVIALLLKHGAKVNKYDRSGNTAMHVLCSRPKLEDATLELLIKHDGNINLPSRDASSKRRCPLHILCDSNDTKTSSLEILLNHDAIVNAADGHGLTPLHCISRSNSPCRNAFELLLKHGADVNICDNEGSSVLHYHCIQNRKDVRFIELFIEQGGDVNQTNKDGKTALYYACDREEVDAQCIQILVKHGAEVNILSHTGLERRSILHCLFQKVHVNISTVEFLLEKGGNLNALDEKQRNVLHYVCDKVLETCDFEFLVSKGIHVNQADNNGQTALIYLCKAESVSYDAVRMVITSGADVNHIDSRKATALHYLCKSKKVHLDCMRMLLEHGADTNARLQGSLGKQTALHLLCQRPDIDKSYIQVLMNSNIDVNKPDSNGKTALHYLCENDAADKETVELLLSSQATVMFSESFDAARKSPIHYLGSRQTLDVGILDLLLQKGTDINQVDEMGRNALLFICCKHTIDSNIVKRFLESGADIHQCDQLGNSAIHYICKHPSTDTNSSKYLLEKGIDVNRANTDGSNPLHIACSGNNYDMAILLIHHGADVNAVDAEGRIALHYCQFPGGNTQAMNMGQDQDSDLTTFLIRKGSDVHKQDKQGRMAYPRAGSIVNDSCLAKQLQRSKLMNAVLDGNMDTVRQLLQSNVDLTAIDVFGRTALHYLCMSKNIDINVLIFFTIKSDVNETDKYGNTAMHYFCRSGRNETSTDVDSVLQTFLRDGLQVDKQDEYGHSVLDYLD